MRKSIYYIVCAAVFLSCTPVFALGSVSPSPSKNVDKEVSQLQEEMEDKIRAIRNEYEAKMRDIRQRSILMDGKDAMKETVVTILPLEGGKEKTDGVIVSFLKRFLAR